MWSDLTMNLVTRSLSTLVLAGSIAALPQGSSVEPLQDADFDYAHSRHLLMRAGFGGSSQQTRDLRDMGVREAVNYLVDFEHQIEPSEAHGIEFTQPPSPDALSLLAADERKMALRQYRRRREQDSLRLRAWWIRRMRTTDRPLEEKLTLFWHNYFACSSKTVRSPFLLEQQNATQRELGASNFEELLREMMRDPALILNYCREEKPQRNRIRALTTALLRDYSLGPNITTEKDITAATQAFAGWSLDKFQFAIDPNNQDFGTKTFLGQVGKLNADDILRIVLNHEATARHLAQRLLSYFAVHPTAAELTPYANILRENDYEIRPVLRTLFNSRWFYSKSVAGRQVKSPVLMLVSLQRALHLSQPEGSQPRDSQLRDSQLALISGQLGQNLFEPPSERAWSKSGDWLKGNRLQKRLQLIDLLMESNEKHLRFLDILVLTKPITAESVLATVEQQFLMVPLSDSHRESMLAFLQGSDGSKPFDPSHPELAEQKLRGLVRQVLWTVEFQRS